MNWRCLPIPKRQFSVTTHFIFEVLGLHLSLLQLLSPFHCLRPLRSTGRWIRQSRTLSVEMVPFHYFLNALIVIRSRFKFRSAHLQKYISVARNILDDQISDLQYFAVNLADDTLHGYSSVVTYLILNHVAKDIPVSSLIPLVIDLNHIIS